MTVWVTGADGQVGRSLQNLVANHGPRGYLFLNRSALDITRREAIEALALVHPPSCIVNLAAYTDVNRAEAEVDTAFLVNATAVKFLAEVAEKHGASLIQISTDYVFDGTKAGPYLETDDTNPLNVYGQSKLQGEVYAQTLCSRHYVIRTSWIFSEFGKNFVTTMANLLLTRSTVSVVDDQIGAPTSARSLANLLFWLVDTRIACGGFDSWGLYHFCQEPYVSWFGFASAIQSVLINQREFDCRLTPCASCDFPQAARRPLNSMLECTKIESLRSKSDSWMVDLVGVLARYNREL